MFDKKVSKTKASDFVMKWKGFLKDGNPENAQYEYLSKKHK